ncbi:uncharacterized protein HMPREF1541_10634 [Cyphellophora europaea CBS 101466]|uniref:Uncharacterized protein n=1 Tax=Cyphellophora europaea (strain CBS 101466) TaxID=1220924 RepID=W2S8W2_CYPE1|nr:uncharacterized protein HMPREF1541_10634 [Cyphellophora europaea CBS 101466]ETN44453.1 hypothetical protein HMPREF1541_10634 [Cyphellophora europaea CBS 101466]
MAAVPNSGRLNPRTAASQQSIWHVTSEETFRRNVVSLGRACKGVVWATDVVTRTTQPIASKIVVPDWGTLHSSEYCLPLAVEKRLSNDFAFIAAAQEGVHCVTTACIKQKISNCNSNTSAEMTLTLRLATNGGIPDKVRSALEDIWRTVQTGAGPGK